MDRYSGPTLSNHSIYRSLVSLFGGVLFLTVTIERIPIPLPVQAGAIPATTLIAVAVVVPLYVARPHITITPLTKLVFLFFGYLVIHSIIWVLIDVSLYGAGTSRIAAWVRQIIALAAGVSVYMTVRLIPSYLSDDSIITHIATGAVPAVILAFLTILGIYGGIDPAAEFVRQVRVAFELRPLGQIRAAGLSLEPSHFGYTLATGVIPFLVVGYREGINGRRDLIGFVLVAVVFAFVSAASVTSAVVFTGLLGGIVLFGPNRRIAIIGIVGAAIAVAVLLVVAPGSYPATQFFRLISGKWGVSITTRAWSTLGPIAGYFDVSDPLSILGYGLGGTTTHLEALVPPEAARDLRAVSYNNMPNLNSMVGRILGEGGIIGITIFAMIFREAIGEALAVREYLDQPGIIAIAPAVLCGLAVGAAVAYGSFALPLLWLWLGLIDAKYLQVYPGGKDDTGTVLLRRSLKIPTTSHGTNPVDRLKRRLKSRSVPSVRSVCREVARWTGDKRKPRLSEQDSTDNTKENRQLHPEDR